MANLIRRGPVDAQGHTISDRTVAGAYLPGIMVKASTTVLTVATGSDIEEQLYVLSNVEFKGQDLATAYTSGDTGIAYRPVVDEVYQVRMAGATYAKGDPLTVGASGYLEAAASGERVLAFFEGTAGAVTAGALQDVRIANSFNLA